MVSEKKKKKGTLWLAVVLIVLLILAVVTSLFYEKTTTTQRDKDIKYQTMACERNSTKEEDLIRSDNTISMSHELRFVFVEDEMKEITYTYKGEYETEADAIKGENAVHSIYNQYMGSVGIDLSSYNPSYNIMKNKVKMNIRVVESQKNLVKSTPRLFFVNAEDNAISIMTRKMQDVENIYNKQGFVCSSN